MRKLIVTVVVLIALLFIFLRFLYKPLSDNLGLQVHSGILVEADKTAQVFLNGNEVGTTPYKNTNLSSGAIKVKIVDASSSAAWEGNVKLSGGTLTVVNRDIATNSAEASGEIISLEKGKGVTVTSNPSEATVTIDGENKGLTPLYLPDLPLGEHQFLFNKENYLKRSVRAVVTQGYSLGLNIDLAQLELVMNTPPPPPPPVFATPRLRFVLDSLSLPFGEAKYLMATIPVVIYGVMRYLYIIYEKKEGESPERVLLTDRPLLATVILWLIMVVFIVYYLGA